MDFRAPGGNVWFLCVHALEIKLMKENKDNGLILDPYCIDLITACDVNKLSSTALYQTGDGGVVAASSWM
jgi:hypothetical protein